MAQNIFFTLHYKSEINAVLYVSSSSGIGNLGPGSELQKTINSMWPVPFLLLTTASGFEC
jgi:hypothetical protein